MNRKTINSTPFGPLGIIWTERDSRVKISQVILSRPGLSAKEQIFQLFPDSRENTCPEIELVVDTIKGILGGNDITIPLETADLASCSEFQNSVLKAESRIPHGNVSTYQLIGKHLAIQNGARAIGNALARNPFPLIVPCHRVIRSDGHLGGYQGGVEMKRALLEMENIPFDPSGRIACNYFYHFTNKDCKDTCK